MNTRSRSYRKLEKAVRAAPQIVATDPATSAINTATDPTNFYQNHDNTVAQLLRNEAMGSTISHYEDDKNITSDKPVTEIGETVRNINTINTTRMSRKEATRRTHEDSRASTAAWKVSGKPANVIHVALTSNEVETGTTPNEGK